MPRIRESIRHFRYAVAKDDTLQTIMDYTFNIIGFSALCVGYYVWTYHMPTKRHVVWQQETKL